MYSYLAGSLLFFFLVCEGAHVTYQQSRLPEFCCAWNRIFDEQRVGQLLCEVGAKAVRINGTFGGLLISNSGAWKASTEYLGQKLGFPFFTGRTHRWSHQWAVGAAYLQPCSCYVDTLEYALKGSYALSQNLPKKVKAEANSYSHRRVAGSLGAEASVTAMRALTSSTHVGIKGTAGYLHYQSKYTGRSAPQGVGVGFVLRQQMGKVTFLGTADWGVALRSYQIRFVFPYRSFEVGAFAQMSHSYGSSTRFSVVGITLDLFFGRPSVCQKEAVGNSFLAWMQLPAVYMPQVLVAKDEKKQILCQAIRVVDAIPDLKLFFGVPLSLGLARYFSGTMPMVFTASGLPLGLELDPLTGQLTGTPQQLGNFSVQVAAENSANEALQAFVIQVIP